MRLFQRLPFKTILFFVVSAIALMPLLCALSLTLPEMTQKFSELMESEHVNQMEKQIHDFELLLRRYEEAMRIIGQLPGTRSMVSTAPLRHAPSDVLTRQLTEFMGNWFDNQDLQALVIIKSNYQVEYLWQNPLARTQPGMFTPVTRAGLITLWNEKAREQRAGKVFIASLDSETIPSGEQHEHNPKILLAVPLVDRQGQFGGLAIGKFFLFNREERHLPFDLMINGVGTVLYDRSALQHLHVGILGHHHQQKTILPSYPDLIKAGPDTRHLFSSGTEEEKVLFWQIFPDKERERSLWVAKVIDTSVLDKWVYAFILRFLVFVSLLIFGAFAVAAFIARKTDRARAQLIDGVTGLVRQQKPIDLHWRWPREMAGLGKELHALSIKFLETEGELHSQARFIRGVFDGIQDGVAVINMDFVVVDTNETLQRWRSELAPLTAKSCYEVFRLRDSPCPSCPSKRAMEEKTIQREEFSVVERGGREKWYEVSAYPLFDEEGLVVSVVEFFRDITEKKQGEKEKQSLEQQLAFAQKMESIGTLAGGVAHDFNNMLSAINGYAELSLMNMAEDDPHKKAMDAILVSGKRAAQITQQLLAFSRKQIIQLESMDLNVEIKETQKIFKRLLGEHIEVVVHAGPGLWPVKADRTQISQVLINMAVNARDAMEEGGTLTIETKNIKLAADYAQTQHDHSSGDYVLLSVSDTGQGMSKETMAHIFEPFFTTKEKSKGTGLGLSTSYGIIRQHGGSIHVYSEPGQGTIFKIYLPRLVDQAEASPHDESGKNTETTGGSETILLVEDDPLVRAICVDILIDLGYTILEAEDGQDGLQVFDRYHGTIDLLLTDVVMPRMGGTKLAEKIRQRAPETRVLFMSGYMENSIAHHGVLKEEDIHFMHKPISPDILASTIRKVFES